MKRFEIAAYTLFLPVILWGILLGGIVYSHIVYFPVYLSDLPASASVVTGKYGMDEALFWMLIHPALVLMLIVSLIINWKLPPRRKLILTSLGIYIIVLVVTSLYFIPELMAFKASPQSTISPAEWLTRANRWQNLSYIRGTFMFIGFIPLLIALTKSNESETAIT
jgi:uncharacterized membrane protein